MLAIAVIPAQAAPAGAQASPGRTAGVGTQATSGAVPACPGDRAVWVNERSRAYHVQGDPLFGRTRHGKYACEAAAKAEGDHPAKAAPKHGA